MASLQLGRMIPVLAALSLLGLAACSEGTDSADNNNGGTSGSEGGASNAGTSSQAGNTSTTQTFHPLFTFDINKEGVMPGDTSTDPSNLTTSSTTTWDGTDGISLPQDSPQGSLKVEIPFTDYGQGATFEFHFDTPQDFSGTTLTIFAKLDSGFTPDPSSPGGIIFFAKSGTDWIWGERDWANMSATDMGDWLEFKWPVDQPGTGSVDGFDPSEIQGIGFKFDTGSGLNASSTPTAAVFHVDSIGYYE